MSDARRRQRLVPVSAASRRGAGRVREAEDRQRRELNVHPTAQSVALGALEARLDRTSCPLGLYDLALRTVRRGYPSACAALLEIDAESLFRSRSDTVRTPGCSRHLVDRIAATQLSIDADDLLAIDHGGQDGLESIEGLLERRLELRGLVVGRVRLDGAVVALLVLHRAAGVALDRDRDFIDRVAERVSTRMDASMDAFWASVLSRSL